MMKFRFLLIALVLIGITHREGYSRQDTKGQQPREIKAFNFVPETVYPLGRRPRLVNGDFILQLKTDTVLCYLPYFGEATSIDYGNRKSSTDFTSAKFSYIESKGKKDAVIITIQPQDNRDVRTIVITCFPGSEYANVALTFNQRQSISYRGRIVWTGSTGK